MKIISTLFLLFLTFALSCRADMGSIPFKKGVRVIEPRQDAIIAWNGREQLLYLQTTLAASEETKILEVMPLPSRPTVDASEMDVFKRCQSLLPRVVVRDSGGAGPFGTLGGGSPAKVVERKIIGAHDIQIVELLDADRFSAWVSDKFGATNEGLEVPAELLKVVGEYAKDGYKWFLFDVVDVEMEEAKKTPLRIRFETDHLYYPMRITRTEKGHTTVSLSVLTTVLFDKEDCVGIPRGSISMPARPIEISGAKVNWIDPPLYHLLGRPDAVKLRTWEISGEIDSFQKDLLIRNPANAKKKEPEIATPSKPTD